MVPDAPWHAARMQRILAGRINCKDRHRNVARLEGGWHGEGTQSHCVRNICGTKAAKLEKEGWGDRGLVKGD